MFGEARVEQWAFTLWARYELACEGHDLLACKSRDTIRGERAPTLRWHAMPTEMRLVDAHAHAMFVLVLERAVDLGISTEVLEEARRVHLNRLVPLADLVPHALALLPDER